MKKLAEQVRNGEQIPDEDILRYHRGIAALQQRIDFETAPRTETSKLPYYGDPQDQVKTPTR